MHISKCEYKSRISKTLGKTKNTRIIDGHQSEMELTIISGHFVDENIISPDNPSIDRFALTQMFKSLFSDELEKIKQIEKSLSQIVSMQLNQDRDDMKEAKNHLSELKEMLTTKLAIHVEENNEYVEFNGIGNRYDKSKVLFEFTDNGICSIKERGPK